MEKETKHTPGPWRVNYDFKCRNDDYNEIIAGNGFSYDEPGFSITGCINIHDAELIASAPTLKAENEALKYRILEIEKCEQDLSGRLQTELSEMKAENTRLKSELLHRDVTVLPQKDFEYEEMKKEREELVNALERIHNPIKWMQDNLQPGEVINGQMAVQLSDSASYLKSIAFSTLDRIKK